ncbi:hypothetical protein [Marinobacter profundi]|uniref:Uncharacterized protein n=1 Tax=Marinobacter profundi TaxID=2666256 RepID=A0A2G1UMN7_9GAMM|nr:hypothetical protein [Marinobacter profundi]PHQ15732.1 hypothetical protein CLH61_06150 [Marinobacter profundi]
MKSGILTILAMTSLAGCGGSSENETATTEPEILCLPAIQKYSQETAQNAGVYRGFLEIAAEESSDDAYAILTPSGRITVISSIGIVTGYFSDSVQVSGNVDLWSAETERTNYSLNGLFVARDSIQGYNLGIFDYQFHAQYQVPNEDICLAAVDATGSWSQTYDEVTTTLTIDADNTFTGSDSTGCVYAGSLNDPSVEGGVFEIEATVSNCIKSGIYKGAGSVLGVQPQTADLIFGVLWNEDRHIGLSLER